jgi:hypothetical protein
VSERDQILALIQQLYRELQALRQDRSCAPRRRSPEARVIEDQIFGYAMQYRAMQLRARETTTTETTPSRALTIPSTASP